MKITNLSGWEDDNGRFRITATVIVTGAVSLAHAIGIVGNLVEMRNLDDAMRSEPEEAPTVAPVQPSEPEPTVTRRRRTTTEEAAPATAEPDAPAETTTRRRRAATTETAQPAEEPAPVVVARRRAQPAVSDDITDADLTKAASDAAAVCGPAAVTAILGEFNVKMTGEIESQEDRKEFLELLKTNIEAFEAAKGVK